MQVQTPTLTIRALRTRPVEVPLARPLTTSGGVIATAPLALVDLLTEEGVTGSAYVFCYTSPALVPVARLVAGLEPLVRGERVAPVALDRKLQSAFRLLGPQGLTGIAMAAIDMAAWDALARAQGLPLVRLLGGEPRPVRAYDSRGMDGPRQAAADAEAAAGAGFGAIKVKVGYAGAAGDLEVVRAVREASDDRLRVMVDYNQCLTVPEAVARARALEPEGLAWIEEPTLAHDLEGHARIAREAAAPIQLGENLWGPPDLARSIAAGASDLVMLDVMKIGGVTGWLRAAALAEAAGLPVSSHIFPEVSAHLLPVTPTCDWLEYLDAARPVLREPVDVRAGSVTAGEAPGSGVAWDEDAVARYLVT
jgi:mandelate racemase